MSIIEFEQEGYHRLTLKDISRVEMFPLSKIQMILGTNGSGKTALMAELSELPSSKADFPNGGFKRVVKDHKGNIYEGLSDFRSGKPHYRLTKNEEVIYEGHSSTAYAAHVKSETGLTRDIHNMRIGLKRFTDMKKDERREWFTNLSPQDYSYAIGYYKRLATATRDITGAINRINVRLLKEKESLISAQEETDIRKEIEDLKATKSEMMQYWRPLDITFDTAISGVDGIDNQLKELVKGFDESLRIFCNAKGYKDSTGIWEDITQTQTELAIIEKQIEDLHQLIEDNQVLLRDAIVANGKDKDSVMTELADVSRSINHTKLMVLVDDWKVNASEALAQYDLVVANLIPIMTELEEDKDLEYTNAQHTVNTAKLSEVQKLIDGWERELLKHNTIVQTYEHRSNEEHSECPKCKHTWIRGYSKEVHEKAIIERDNVFEKIEELKRTYDAIKDKLETSSYQIQLMNQISNLARASVSLAPMWKELTNHQFIRVNPSAAIEYVRATRLQIELTVQLLDLQAHAAELTESLKVLDSSSSLNHKELKEKNDSYEAKLIHLQKEQYYLSNSLSALKKAQKAMDFQEKFVVKTEDLLAKRNDWISKAEVANKHTAINAAMMNIEAEITERERRLSLVDTQHSLIRALENEVEESKSKEKLLKKAMKALSPSEGLIAKGLTGFINHFIAQMNAVIEKVWLYPLVIQPIQLEDDAAVDLDYMFPFLVDNKTKVPDVSNGSGAQEEIFNLAFMLVSMIHLGLDESEIFLDEFSIKMDYSHRREATKLIMDLVKNSNFSQIYMISHYEASYGTMGDMDVTVLCPDNIQLPPSLKYNVNSKVTH